MSETGLTKTEYERQQRSAGLWPDITYGPSGSAHPYDFEPDSDLRMAESAERSAHQEACRQVEEGTWQGAPSFQLGVVRAGWGWGTRRWWMTREEYEAMIGPVPSESDEVQLLLMEDEVEP